MRKVLIADDEPMIRDGLAEMLTGFESGLSIVGKAKNGVEALNMAEIFGPDIILADICMPKLSGLDFVRQLRETEKSKSDIIIISGYHEFEYARQAISLGVREYLLKPIKEEELKSILERLKVPFKEIRRQRKGFVGECLELLKEQYTNRDMDLGYAASKLFVSPDYLSHKLKEETGLRFTQWLIKLRLQRAIELLETKEYSINTVSEMVGFANQHYFSKVFKQYMGESPRQYGEKYDKNQYYY